MSYLRAAGLSLAVSSMMLGSAVQAQDLTDQESQISYSIGVNIGQGLMQQGLAQDVDVEIFMQGLQDSLEDNVQLSQEQIMAALQAFQQQMVAEQQAQVEAARGESMAFLEQNAQRDGVMVTESGLQYEVLEEGDGGVSPSETDTVLAHYEGRLSNGDVFDSSIERGEPTEFALNQVIPGWTEGLQLMETGDKYRFYIPSELAYGQNGQGPIPPFAALVFDVELLEVVSQ